MLLLPSQLLKCFGKELGCLKERMGEHQEALHCCEKSIEMAENTYGLVHFLTAESYRSIAWWYCYMFEEKTKGLEYYTKALEILNISGNMEIFIVIVLVVVVSIFANKYMHEREQARKTKLFFVLFCVFVFFGYLCRHKIYQ